MSKSLRDALAGLDGVVEARSAFKDETAYWVNGKEIAHFEGERAIDIRLTRAGIRDRRQELRADPRVRLRPTASDWLTVEFAAADEEFVVALVEAAAAVHRAPTGTIAEPPPTGSDLARRRRFH
ncbi:hypothetical protein SAMN05421812_107157 [Asanoa hainanensis]|uniref:Luciferase domain-containing protein n=1 Tax=Asanoa hainanensis TaxID=560556 RepID=A0A239N221_9ACTN|nr:luciferase family protein [Asanoa hainanensis]SNT48945.1 hypothetical protein SAMN05421812_107157 [Asanoa hainanensis]